MADLEPDLLVSCLYAHLDFKRDRAVLASAGHLPPLVRRPGSPAEPVRLDPGPLLGVDPAAQYPTTTLELPVGSLLALYTDGLIEAPGIDLDQATLGLAEELTAAEPKDLDQVIDALLRRGRPNGRYLDDIAVLLAHRLPDPPVHETED
jgi:serine phosphatase RsbU (regulator of sigma subunit)